jgi:hypothetical protein
VRQLIKLAALSTRQRILSETGSFSDLVCATPTFGGFFRRFPLFQLGLAMGCEMKPVRAVKIEEKLDGDGSSGLLCQRSKETI